MEEAQEALQDGDTQQTAGQSAEKGKECRQQRRQGSDEE